MDSNAVTISELISGMLFEARRLGLSEPTICGTGSQRQILWRCTTGGEGCAYTVRRLQRNISIYASRDTRPGNLRILPYTKSGRF